MIKKVDLLQEKLLRSVHTLQWFFPHVKQKMELIKTLNNLARWKTSTEFIEDDFEALKTVWLEKMCALRIIDMYSKNRTQKETTVTAEKKSVHINLSFNRDDVSMIIHLSHASTIQWVYPARKLKMQSWKVLSRNRVPQWRTELPVRSYLMLFMVSLWLTDVSTQAAHPGNWDYKPMRMYRLS